MPGEIHEKNTAEKKKDVIPKKRNLEILRLNIFKYRKKLKNPEKLKKKCVKVNFQSHIYSKSKNLEEK